MENQVPYLEIDVVPDDETYQQRNETFLLVRRHRRHQDHQEKGRELQGRPGRGKRDQDPLEIPDFLSHEYQDQVVQLVTYPRDVDRDDQQILGTVVVPDAQVQLVQVSLDFNERSQVAQADRALGQGPVDDGEVLPQQQVDVAERDRVDHDDELGEREAEREQQAVVHVVVVNVDQDEVEARRAHEREFRDREVPDV